MTAENYKSLQIQFFELQHHLETKAKYGCLLLIFNSGTNILLNALVVQKNPEILLFWMTRKNTETHYFLLKYLSIYNDIKYSFQSSINQNRIFRVTVVNIICLISHSFISLSYVKTTFMNFQLQNILLLFVV